MKKNYQVFIGIDVSKGKLDYCIISDPFSNQHQFGIVANTEKGIKQLMTLIKKKYKSDETIVCLENTGVYSMPLCYWAQHFKIDYWVVPALEIKKAKGISRGKNDKADSKDIASYCIESLIKITGQKDFRKDIQLLITSHSTHITTKIDFENTVVLYESGNEIISHYILDGFSDSALGKKQIKYLNKYLDAVNANLFYSRKIILVEGISEKLLVPVFFKIITTHSTEKSSCCVINVNGLAFSYFLEIVKNGFFQKCLVLTDSDASTKTRDRADSLATKYGNVSQIKIGITQQTTFEKDLISFNKVGEGRDILLKVLKDVRPNSGTSYCESLRAKAIVVEEYFALIEEYKSEFAYSLMLNLEEDSKGFIVPTYISDGINFLA